MQIGFIIRIFIKYKRVGGNLRCMKQSFKILFEVLLVTLIIISCNKNPIVNNKNMDNVDLTSNRLKMYFIKVNTNDVNQCSFIKEYKNFYIDKSEIIKIFRDKLTKNETERLPLLSKCSYMIQILQDGVIKYGAMLDILNKKIAGSKNFDFDLNEFEKYKDNFKKLESYEIRFNSLKTMNIIMNGIKELGGFLPGISDIKKEDFSILNCKGRILLLADSNYIITRLNRKDIIEKFMNDFKGIGNIKLMSYYPSERDSFTFEILCEKDITKSIPAKFKIIEPFNDSIDLTFDIYDIKGEKIEEIIYNKGYNDIVLIDLNK